LSVPQDISVIGYADTYLAVNVSPKLTTMHVDSARMGQAAVQLLKMCIDHPQAARMTLTIHPALIERNSVATPRINPLLTFPIPKEDNQP
jgi:DNA-binding LacI/PurR family transcriptional regulator